MVFYKDLDHLSCHVSHYRRCWKAKKAEFKIYIQNWEGTKQVISDTNCKRLAKMYPKQSLIVEDAKKLKQISSISGGNAPK